MAFKEIGLTQGQVALVDEEDYTRLASRNWYAAWSPITKSYYAQSHRPISGGQTTDHMHRVIVGLEHGDKRHCDHRNRNTLDNRRENLRIATRSQNQANTLPRSASGLKGAYFRKDVGKWQGQIGINRKVRSLGFYATPEEAHAAYCRAAKELHGEFARTG